MDFKSVPVEDEILKTEQAIYYSSVPFFDCMPIQ